MSDLSSVINGVVAPIFSTEQSAISDAQSSLEDWAADTGATCCTIIVAKLNSEPHMTNIANLFSSNATYVGGPNPSPANRLFVNYIIDDSGSPPDISESDHTSLLEMSSGEREYEVLKQVEEHYNNELRFLRATYTHTDGNNKKLNLRIAKFETV